MTIIRNAVAEDVEEMVRIGETFHKESAYSTLDWDDNKVSLLIHGLIILDNGIALVAVDDQDGNRIVGGFIGSVFEHMFGKSLMSQDFVTFVVAEKRGSTLGFRLMKSYIEQAKALGVEAITIGNSGGVVTESLHGLYRKMGFSKYAEGYRLLVEQ